MVPSITPSYNMIWEFIIHAKTCALDIAQIRENLSTCALVGLELGELIDPGFRIFMVRIQN